METKLNVTYGGKDKMFLHTEVGKGKMPDGRECRLIQTNGGLHLQVTNKDQSWQHFSVSWMDISKAISEVVPKIEKNNH